MMKVLKLSIIALLLVSSAVDALTWAELNNTIVPPSSPSGSNAVTSSTSPDLATLTVDDLQNMSSKEWKELIDTVLKTDDEELTPLLLHFKKLYSESHFYQSAFAQQGSNKKVATAQREHDDLFTDLHAVREGSQVKALPTSTRSCPTNNNSSCCCDGIVPITPSMIGTTGYTITRSGHYCLEFTTAFSPLTSGRSAITFAADNVLLDLNGQTLSQGNSIAGTIGININGATNVAIYNGRVANFTFRGISGNAVNNVRIEDVDVVNNGDSTTTFAGAIILSSTNNVFCDHVRCINNKQGTRFMGCNAVTVLNSNFDSTVQGNALGFNIAWNVACFNIFVPPFTACSNFYFKNCTFNNALSQNGAAAGLQVITVFGLPRQNDFMVIDCQASGNVGGGVSDPTQIIEGEGFAFGPVDNFTVINCTAQGNKCLASSSDGIGTGSNGFSLSINNGYLENCSAEGNTTIGTRASGFAFGRSNNLILKKCSAMGNANFSNGLGVGFYSDPGPNGGLTITPPIAVNNIVEACVASANTSVSGTSIGFAWIGQTNGQLLNSQANGNGIGILVANSAAPSPVIPSVNNIIKNNIVSNNTIAGISDTSGDATMYAANTARTNGTNYVTLPAGTPIRNWAIPGAPAAVNSNGILDPALDNMNVTP